MHYQDSMSLDSSRLRSSLSRRDSLQFCLTTGEAEKGMLLGAAEGIGVVAPVQQLFLIGWARVEGLKAGRLMKERGLNKFRRCIVL